MYITPLRTIEPPVLPPARLDSFIHDVFHNYKELYHHHKRLLDRLQEIQREQHPQIKSITEAVLDAFLNFREAYLEYVPNYPIAAYRIDDEMATNIAFKAFVEVRVSCRVSLCAAGLTRSPRTAMRAAPRRAPTGHEELRQPADPAPAPV
jgi:hypothetical protein